MPPTRPRVPEYPRPVSPICTDQAPICKGTIIYHDPNDGIIEDPGERAAKRRRIEACAAACLRGTPPFLLSAQLKGPFDKDWQNPWARQRRTRNKPAVSLEVPETTPRRQQEHLASGQSNVQGVRVRQGYDEGKTQLMVTRVVEMSGQSDHELWPDASPLKLDVEDPKARTAGPRRTPRSEHWLKRRGSTSHAIAKKVLSSPTPSHARLPAIPANNETLDTGRNLPSERLQEDVPSPTSNAQDLTLCNPETSTATYGPATDQRKPTNGSGGPLIVQRNNKLPATQKRRVDTSSPFRSGLRRKLKTRNAAERKPFEMAPPSTNQSAFEYRRVSSPREGRNKTDEPNMSSKSSLTVSETRGIRRQLSPSAAVATTASNDESASLHTAEESLRQSMVTSKTSDVLELPSAQVQAHLPPPPSTTSLSTNDALTEVLPLSVPQAASDVAASVLQQDQDKRADKRPSDKAIDTAQVAGNSSPESPKPLDTQGLIASITPFAMSTAKKASANVLNISTPVTASKASVGMKRSRDGGVLGAETKVCSSQGSLKTALKVAKTSAKPFHKKTSFDLDFENSIHNSEGENEAHPGIIVSPRGSQSKPRSILKSANAPTPASRTNASSSAVMKQDAQRAAEAGGDLVDDDDFDLDAAIDDLGSFLGHWDAEKEAESLRGHMGV